MIISMKFENGAASQPNFVLYDFYNTQQFQVEFILHNFKTLRDYYDDGNGHNPVNPAIIFIVLGSLAASAINATLIAKGHPEYRKGAYPTFVAALKPFDNGGRTVEEYWHSYYPPKIRSSENSPEMPNFFPSLLLQVNYAYCSVTKKRTEKFWNISIFARSFDVLIWLALLTALAMVSFLEDSSIKLQKYSFHFLKTLAVLISPGTVGSERKTSGLFFLWMMTSLVVVIYYTGDMTSKVISPAPEEILSGVSDLEKRNYSLIFLEPVTQNIVNESLRALVKQDYVPPGLPILYRLFHKEAYQQAPLLTIKFFEDFIEKERVTHINMWPFAVYSAIIGNHELSKRGKYPGEKKCHVGEKLVPAGTEVFTAFLPPNAQRLKGAFQRFEDSGIMARWNREFLWLIIARRVQHRGQVISPTRLGWDGLEKVFVTLKMEGQTVVIFFLWGTCIFVCFITFCYEFYKR